MYFSKGKNPEKYGDLENRTFKNIKTPSILILFCERVRQLMRTVEKSRTFNYSCLCDGYYFHTVYYYLKDSLLISRYRLLSVGPFLGYLKCGTFHPDDFIVVM